MTATALERAADRGGPAQPLLEVRHLRKDFPVRGHRFARTTMRAVDDVSFAVAKGETLGVVGESGCGKSTTARLIARLVEPDAGEIVFDGEGVGAYGGLDLKGFRRNLQMVFQDSYASLNPRLSIVDAIAFGPRAHGMGKDAARALARSLLEQVGLQPSQFAFRFPHELSGGQRQRVNIARALAFEPRMLILDESVAALDKSVQAQVLNLLQDLKRAHALTYLFISHDLHVVQYVADRVLVMYLGRVVEMAPVDALYGDARHPYTRALMAAIPTMDPKRRLQRPPLSGDPPSAFAAPSGCRFSDRCPHAAPICETHEPVLLEGRPGHWTACHLDDPVSGHPEAAWPDAVPG